LLLTEDEKKIVEVLLALDGIRCGYGLWSDKKTYSGYGLCSDKKTYRVFRRRTGEIFHSCSNHLRFFTVIFKEFYQEVTKDYV
jgi:hypothetical protein